MGPPRVYRWASRLPTCSLLSSEKKMFQGWDSWNNGFLQGNFWVFRTRSLPSARLLPSLLPLVLPSEASKMGSLSSDPSPSLKCLSLPFTITHSLAWEKRQEVHWERDWLGIKKVSSHFLRPTLEKLPEKERKVAELSHFSAHQDSAASTRSIKAIISGVGGI